MQTLEFFFEWILSIIEWWVDKILIIFLFCFIYIVIFFDKIKRFLMD